VVGAERVHGIIRGWLAALGHDPYAGTLASSG